MEEENQPTQAQICIEPPQNQENAIEIESTDQINQPNLPNGELAEAPQHVAQVAETVVTTTTEPIIQEETLLDCDAVNEKEGEGQAEQQVNETTPAPTQQPSTPVTLTYWQTKLPQFLEEISNLLSIGIDRGQDLIISATNPEAVSARIEETLSQQQQQESENNEVKQSELEKKLIKECCIWVVEGKSGVEFDLITLSGVLKEAAESLFSNNSTLASSLKAKTIDFYRDIIVESAEKKNYGIKLTKDISNLLSKAGAATSLSASSITQNMAATTTASSLHDIWEVKEIQVLALNTRIEDLDLLRKKRRFHQSLLKALDKLIKSIDKSKGEDDAFGAYSKIIANPPKLKVQQKLPAKKSQQQQPTTGAAAGTADENQEENLKRTKVNDEAGAATNTENNPEESKGKQSPTENGSVEQQSSNLNSSSKKKVQRKKTKESSETKEAKTTSENAGDSQITEENPITVTPKKPAQNSKKQNSDSQKKAAGTASTTGANSATTTSSESGAAPSSNTSNSQNTSAAAAAATKDSNQKKIFSFFKKPAVSVPPKEQESTTQVQQPKTEGGEQSQSDVQAPAAPPVPQKKSLLRKIGGADPRPAHLQTSNLIAETTSTTEVFKLIQQASKDQWKILKEQQKKRSRPAPKMNLKQPSTMMMMTPAQAPSVQRRRILVTIHDYVRQYKYSFFDQKSKIITGKNFLKRDEDAVQYDLDTEDELQEMNAENIENEDDDDDDDGMDNEGDDSNNQFIVPDGYLSDEGFDSDKEEQNQQSVFDQKKLNFHNFNFTENTSKIGFIHTQADESIDVQNFLMNYRVRNFTEPEQGGEPFPLSMVKKANLEAAAAENAETAARTIVWTPERMKVFIRSIHGSFQSKKQMLEAIMKIELMKDVSKNRLEKKFKEITQKDMKSENETGKRWLVHAAILESLDFEQNEIDELKKARQDEYKASRPKKEDKIPSSSNQNAATVATPQPVLVAAAAVGGSMEEERQSQQESRNQKETDKPITIIILDEEEEDIAPTAIVIEETEKAVPNQQSEVVPSQPQVLSQSNGRSNNSSSGSNNNSSTNNNNSSNSSNNQKKPTKKQATLSFGQPKQQNSSQNSQN